MGNKKQEVAPNRSNRIRFVLVEADISDGNLSELTQAIASALKPSASTPRIAFQSNPPILSSAAEPAMMINEEVAESEGETSPEDEAPGQKTERVSRTKKFKAPEYLPDLLDSERRKRFKEFADEKRPANKNKKYLVAAYWLKEHAAQSSVNANMIYTCFKTAGWSTGFNDWNQTFYNLMQLDHMRKLESGEFAINPLGEDQVNQATD